MARPSKNPVTSLLVVVASESPLSPCKTVCVNGVAYAIVGQKIRLYDKSVINAHENSTKKFNSANANSLATKHLNLLTIFQLLRRSHTCDNVS